ncbi:MAG: hypothetical protein SO411_02925, partial [Bacteroidaceae bacterium]|nr:hypothetical protein [Bacteroidaceae bacterium]
ALATLCGLQAQTAADGALYVYRTDGRFTVLSAADVDSITYSRYDAQGQLHDSWQMQLVHTRGSVTAIPLSVIDSVSLATPQAGTKGIDYVEQPAANVQGAGTAASPYMTVSAAPLGVSLQAECHYTDARGEQHHFAPKATLSITARRAMAVAADAEALGTQIQTADGTLTTEGTSPAVHTYHQTLATSGAEGQQFDVELRYEAYTAADGTDLPYLQLSEPRLVGIEVKERSATRLTTTVYDTVRYDVTARFEVDVEAVNTTDALSQTLTLAMHYEGGVVNAQEVEVELVKTEYRKDMIVYEGHDNLHLRAQAVVYRDRYYSDGSIHTDSLKEKYPMALYLGSQVDIPRGTLIADAGDGISGTYLIADGLTIQYTRHEEFKNIYTASIWRCVNSIGVPDFDNLSSRGDEGLDWTDEEYYLINRPSKDLSEYQIFELFNTYYDASNPQDGIYYYPVDNAVSNSLGYKYKHNGKYYKISKPNIDAIWYDRIASMDGELITFEEFRPTIKDISNFWNYEEVESSHGSARVYKAEHKGMYLGTEIHFLVIDTVYVVKETRPKIAIKMHDATEVTASKAVLSCTLPGGEDIEPKNVIFNVYADGKSRGIQPATSKSADGVYSVMMPYLRAGETFEYWVSVSTLEYQGTSDTLTLTTPEKYTEEDAVDLGLSVLWAKYPNQDANRSSQCANEGDYKRHSNIYHIPEEWSDGWRLPTKAEWEELCNKCTWEEMSAAPYGSGKNIAITGTNGNQMFLYKRYNQDTTNYLVDELCNDEGRHWFINFPRGSFSYSFVEDIGGVADDYARDQFYVRLVRDK